MMEWKSVGMIYDDDIPNWMEKYHHPAGKKLCEQISTFQQGMTSPKQKGDNTWNLTTRGATRNRLVVLQKSHKLIAVEGSVPAQPSHQPPDRAPEFADLPKTSATTKVVPSISLMLGINLGKLYNISPTWIGGPFGDDFQY